MEWTKYNRNAIPGEDVYYYPAGRADQPPIVARCTASSGLVTELSLFRPGHARHQCLNSVRHINDPHFRKYPERLVAEGAWDFHPIVGELWNAQHLRNEEQRRRLQDLPVDEMSAEEVEALEALDRLGPVIGKIAKDVGVTPERLKKMEHFMEEFSRKKDEQSKAKSTVK